MLLTQMATNAKDRPRYSKQQLERYFDRIELPQTYRDSPVMSDPTLARTKEHGLPLIQAMTRYHTSHIPFENLQMHYSGTRKISLNMDDLYDRFADTVGCGSGGRCMQNNGFFGTVMRSLGYNVRNGGSRVSRSMYPDTFTREHQAETYDPWDHMVNFVKFDQEWWLVDVGMAAMGPNMPIPIEDNFITNSIGSRKIRLQLRVIPEHAADDLEDAPKLWCFDVSHSQNPDGTDIWLPTYCFTMAEFLPQDYECASWYTTTYPRSYFARWLLVTKMILSEDGTEVVGDLSLVNNFVQKRILGKKEFGQELKTEADRVTALKELFGITLSEEDQQAISPHMKLG
ncbi:uncharacterized protein MYCFIDRAFT_182695 [Pseudocercospora fijiensis CIRAD86]|uniref:Uncharacterized protein n=1 Tax=Pseudocercospora fijiensis (strain CIRAD86) TaxID=383855 RepID=M2ZVH2_PSEFD|nr:uncharacterized protein MYCFIDRAFT_182695 [Pseudocercospora fijiensis CIRAD86]EME83004.1 hypothetical protein MYCFIDRAFT_182695 [Pseudocercospora fijiensis CIRAD86]